MKKLALIAALGLAGPAFAQDPESCAMIDAGDERLACYDGIFRADQAEASEDAATVEAADEPDLGEWMIETETSPIDDTTSVFLTLESEDWIPGPYGQAGPMVLHIRCMENTTAAILYFNEHFMWSRQGGGRVEYRIDDQPADTIDMEASNNNVSLGLWNGRRSIPWIEDLLIADTLFVRAVPMNAGPLGATFDLTGLDAAIAPVRENCGW
jgi:type VI secretion system protein VasI